MNISDPAKVSPPADVRTESSKLFPLWRSAVVIILIGFCVLLVSGFHGVDNETESGVSMTLPDSLGDYLGFNSDITAEERIGLPEDTEFVKKRYIGPNPEEINCEIVLSGAHKNSIHRPQVCLVAQGWTIRDEKPIQVLLPDRREQRVRLLTLSRTENGQLIVGYYLYWFVGKDRTTDDHFQRILLSSWDRVLKGVNHRWAYVIVSSFIPTRDLSEQKKTQLLGDLIAFSGEIIPRIQKKM
jgi:hypothetical protein